MSQTKFKEGDIVFLKGSGTIAKTIEKLQGDDAVVVWQCPVHYELCREAIGLSALKLSRFNPRTILHLGDIVSFTEYDGKSIFATVTQIKETTGFNALSIGCSWFTQDDLNYQEFDLSEVEKVFHPFFALYAITTEDGWSEEEEVFLGNYTTHEEAIELIEGFGGGPVPDFILDSPLNFADLDRKNPDLFATKFKEKDRRTVFTSKVLNKG